MYLFICKECGKEFKSYHKTAKYCSKECSLKNFTNASPHNRKNIKNKKYGRLIVIEKSYVKNGQSYWLCQCDCGNTRIVPIDSLTSGKCKSCGCLQKEKNIHNAKNNKKLIKYRDNTFMENTNLASLKSTLSQNNTSGTKGVCWCKHSNSWKAYITFQKKNYSLGYFKDINKAIQARKAAEEKYFKPILDKYKKLD